MSGFDLYPQAWVVYILLGIILLFMLDLKLKKLPFAARVSILALIAVGAFTPQTVSDANSLAPMILTTLLNAEVEGVKVIYKSFTTLIIIWGIVVAAILAGKHFYDAKRKPTSPTQ
jgi:membrane-bound ClpP family serine protease